MDGIFEDWEWSLPVEEMTGEQIIILEDAKAVRAHCDSRGLDFTLVKSPMEIPVHVFLWCRMVGIVKEKDCGDTDDSV